MRKTDPWQYMDEHHPDIPVRFRTDLGDKWGETVWIDGHPEIHLAVDLGAIQARCTLLHEIGHVERGAPCRPYCPDDEAQVSERTARWMLPDITEIAHHLREGDLRDAARLLGVTRLVLTERLQTMTDEELHALRRAMAGEPRPPTDAAACTRSWCSDRRTDPPPACHRCTQASA